MPGNKKTDDGNGSPPVELGLVFFGFVVLIHDWCLNGFLSRFHLLLTYACSRSPRSKAFLASSCTPVIAWAFNARYSAPSIMFGVRGLGRFTWMIDLIVPGREVITTTLSAR